MWEVKKLIKKGDYLYCVVLGHPKATKNGYVLHHRIIMENHLGRLLNPEEVVHHINGDKLDNRIENLELLSVSKHVSLHGKLRGKKYADLQCPWCSKIFSREYRQCFKIKRSLYTACSKQCRGHFSRFIQQNGITTTTQSRLDNNLVRVYTKYADVS
jgi:hypothetical protein